MSRASARDWLHAYAPDLTVYESPASTATVADAAAALGVVPGRIAKSLAFRAGEGVYLLVTRGDARLDNIKTRATFAARPRLLDADETLAVTGHAVGGVCPFGLATPVPVLCDISLKGFVTVFPAAGCPNSAVELTPQRLATLVGARWVDICRLPEASE